MVGWANRQRLMCDPLSEWPGLAGRYGLAISYRFLCNNGHFNMTPPCNTKTVILCFRESSEAPYPTELALSPLRSQISIGSGANPRHDAYLELGSEDSLLSFELSKRALLENHAAVVKCNLIQERVPATVTFKVPATRASVRNSV